MSLDLNRRKEQERKEKELRQQNMKENMIIISEARMHVFEDYKVMKNLRAILKPESVVTPKHSKDKKK